MLGSESAWSSSLVLEVDVLNATLAILIMEDTVLNRVLNRVCEVRPHLIVLKLHCDVVATMWLPPGLPCTRSVHLVIWLNISNHDKCWNSLL